MEMRVSWSGPYAWPELESQRGLSPLPRHSGIYLWTFEYQDGYLIYVAGVTRRLFRRRFLEHTQIYLSGGYNILRLYAAPAPFCDVPDKGMFIAPRLPGEEPITVLNACASKLHCLPERLSI